MDRPQSPDNLQRILLENEVLAAVSRVITSSVDIREVYEEFARQVGRLMAFDRIAILEIDEERQTTTPVFVAGVEVSSLDSKPTPLRGTPAHRVTETLAATVVEAHELRSGALQALWREGLRSMVVAPLVVRRQAIGALALTLTKEETFTQEDVAVAERIAAQIAGAVHNARLYAKEQETKAALQEQEELYRTLLETSPFAVALVDADATILFANQRTALLLGERGPEDIIGRSSLQWIAPEERELAIQHLGQVIQTGALRDVAHTLVRSDGRRALAEINGSAVMTRQGAPRVMVVLRDVTAARQAEEALRDSEERYRSLVETSPDAIVLIDLEARILLANHQAARLHGIPDPLELIGRTGFGFFIPEDQPRARQNLERVLREGTLTNIEYTLERANGQHYPVEISASSVPDREGRPAAVMVVVRDMSERKRAEALVRELSTPILPLEDRLLLLPLIGEIDEPRIDQMRSQLLTAIHAHRAKAVVIDVTGVVSMDSHRANTLLHTAAAARLLGATTILTGISAEVAHALIGVGVDLSGMEVLGQLRDGLARARELLRGQAATLSQDPVTDVAQGETSERFVLRVREGRGAGGV